MALNSNYNSLYSPVSIKTERGAITAITGHFKRSVNENNFYWQSTENLKILGFSATHKLFTDKVFEKAIEYLQKRGFKVIWRRRSDAKGWFNAFEYSI